MADKKQFLFLFSIGPVQSFIAQARKTQDLYASSRILSTLAEEGLVAAKPIKMIFPSRTSTPSVPNRFLCIIEVENPKQKGKEIEDAVQTKWSEIAGYVLDFTEIKGIKEQIEAQLDINWTFVEITEGYHKAYQKIERLLGAVKNARSFEQFNYQLDKEGENILGEKGRKCSLDGERNVKFYKRTEKEQIAKDDINLIDNKLFSKENEVYIDEFDRGKFKLSELQSGEGLSAVSMVKRKFGHQTFPSVAAISLKEELNKIGENTPILNCFKNLFNSNFPKACLDIVNLNLAKNVEIETNSGIWNTDFDEQLLFEENLTKKRIPNESQLALAKKLQAMLKDDFTQKYYAIIDFDGDNMGKWLSGDNINNPEINIEDFHQKLSDKLAAFAIRAKDIVDKYGQTVYAGGDDFLGFVNLNYLYIAMEELRTKFKVLVNDELQKLSYLKTELSFSAGVCIAHYKEPLSMVLDKANKAQKTAKCEDKGKRNAFSIVASKHSGENHEAYFNWGMDCENVKYLERVKDELIKTNRFSNKFIKSLNIEFARLTDKNGKLIPSQRPLLEAEVIRLLKRSFMGNKDDRKVESEAFTKTIMAIYDNAASFDNFINALNICDFMHRLLATSNNMEALTKPEKELFS